MYNKYSIKTLVFVIPIYNRKHISRMSVDGVLKQSYSNIENKDVIIKGDGCTLITYLYMANLVIWLFSILLNSNDKSIYNVGSSKKISIYDLAKKVSKSLNNYNGNIKVLTESNYNYPTPKYIPDNTKIIKELGVTENYSLDESIKRTIEWNLNNIYIKGCKI